MKSYKSPSFQERVGRAAEAKQKALDGLRAKAPADPAIAAARQAARLKREAAAAEKRDARRQAAEAAKAEATPAPTAPAPSEAERKAARDARYAARKSRK